MKKLLVILLFIPSLLFGTNYYVKDDGNDANTGLSDAQAWLTLTKVQAAIADHTIGPGDVIYFKRGDKWITPHYTDIDDVAAYGGKELLIEHSGTAGNPITLSAYGTGARPIITGRWEIPAWDTPASWTDMGNNIWRYYGCNYAGGGYTARGRLWLNGTEAKKAQSLTTPTAQEPWTHSESTLFLYVYSVGNPATVYTKIEDQGWSNYAILIRDADYITIKNLNLGGNNHTLGIQYSSNIIIDSCDIGWDTGMMGIGIYGQYGESNNGIIRNCTFDTNDELQDAWLRQNTEDGVHMRDGVNDWDVYSNSFKNWGHTAVNLITQLSVDYVVKDINIYNNTITAPDIDYGRGIGIDGANTAMSGISVFNNFIYNTPTRNQLAGPGIRFYNNIIDYVRGTSYLTGYDDFAEGILIYANTNGLSNPQNMQIYNNTILNCYGAGIRIYYYGTANKEHNLIKNNILYNNNTRGDADQSTLNFQLYISGTEDNATVLDNTYQNNLMYSSLTADDKVVYYGRSPQTRWLRNYTAVQFNAYDNNLSDVIQNNLDGDPLFVDATNEDYLSRDYNLSVGSPAIATGIAVGLTTDYVGNVYASSPSIGALEYDSDPPTPTDLPVVETTLGVIKSITGTMSGNVTSDGGGTISARGFVYGTSINPTLSNSVVTVSGTTGTYSGTLRLSSNTTYHVRAYATNESGTSYGADISFTTPVYTQGYTNGKIGLTSGKIGVHK